MISNELRRFIHKNKKPLLGVVILLAVVLAFLGGSILSLIHNKMELKKLTRQTIQLDEEYQQLTQRLKLLKQEDPHYLEHLARTRYHMTKPGEIEFRFEQP